MPGIADFIGFIGLAAPTFEAHFTPAIEVGWRLAHKFWGHGYATEGAIAALQHGFEVLALDEIVSFTTTANIRSRHIMNKIGMHHNPEEDFNNPKILPDSHLYRHVLYKINRAQWVAKHKTNQ